MNTKTKIRSLGKTSSTWDDSQRQYNYQADDYLTQEQTKDAAVINNLIDDITNLDKISHEQIYIMLRGFKPQQFFTTDYNGIHITNSDLNTKEIQELYKTVQMCKRDMKRKKVIDQAKEEYLGNSVAGTADQSETDEPVSVEPVNPSESVKVKQMLKLNRIDT